MNSPRMPELWRGRYDRLFIGGEWVTPSSGETAAVTDPATEEVFERVALAQHTDVDAAVAAARKAFDHGGWPDLPLEERIAVLERLSELLGEHRDEIAALVTAEMGCPITLSTGMQAAGPKALLDAFIELAPQFQWEEKRSHATGSALVTRVPVGVVAAVVPWNAPLLIAVIKIAPALLAGCTVVLKPTPETALDSYLLAELCTLAGLPPGVLSVVPADREVSEYLISHAGVDKVSFTGSTPAGRRIGEVCGRDLRRSTLELGGKSAAVILDDADLDTVIPAIRALSLRSTGQVCSNKTRLVVARSRREELYERLIGMVRAMPQGDPFDPATELGPLANAAQYARVTGYIEEARNAGSTLLVGGGRPAGLDRGFYVEATVFGDVDPDARIAQEEIFGPVLSVHTFSTDDEAAAIANNSVYGLNGSVFSADPVRALGVARRIRTGTVEVNGAGAGFLSPMGGFKASGTGREAGLEGIGSFTETKAYGLHPDVLAGL